MVKSKKPKKFGDKVKRPQPLEDQLASDDVAQPSGRIKIKTERKIDDDEYVAGSLGRNIMKQSLAQLKEIEEEEEQDKEWPALGTKIRRKPKERFDVSFTRKGFKKKTVTNEDESDSDGNSVDEMEVAIPINIDKFVNDFENELGLESEDVDILEHFKQKNTDPQQRLADLFRDKITEKHTEIRTEIESQSVVGQTLSPEIELMCREIGHVLARYRSGPLPKMFKAFPTMNCWEELLYLTQPDKWSAAAMYQATRIFISNLRAPMAQRFCYLVLLPRIRDDISYFKRLNYHLYQALSKALFKSAAFFKGIVLPLCSAGDCTLREAIIVGSVIAKNHIPIANSAAAIKKIAALDYNGANSIFLRIFFDKKYALPYQVLDECVDHFKRFEADNRILPVLWHQSLLAFVQRYKNDISSDQKTDFMRIVNHHGHFKVTPEIRRELNAARNRTEDEAMNVD